MSDTSKYDPTKDIPLWAKEKAREWLVGGNLDGKGLDPVWLDTTSSGVTCLSSLAALLREVFNEGWTAGRESTRPSNGEEP
jgi:hypothetical protein